MIAESYLPQSSYRAALGSPQRIFDQGSREPDKVSNAPLIIALDASVSVGDFEALKNLIIYVGKKEKVDVDGTVGVNQDLNGLVEQAMMVMGVLNERSAAQEARYQRQKRRRQVNL